MKRSLQPCAPTSEQPSRDLHPAHQAPELLTQLQICRRLGIGVTTWRRWRAARLVPAPVPMPGRPRWTVRDIELFKRGLVGAGRRYFGTARQVS